MHPIAVPYFLGMIAFFYGFLGEDWKKAWPRKKELQIGGILVMAISISLFFVFTDLKG